MKERERKQAMKKKVRETHIKRQRQIKRHVCMYVCMYVCFDVLFVCMHVCTCVSMYAPMAQWLFYRLLGW